ncbi:hypothetical protein KCG54_04155 [Neisseria subflava]|uniref:CRISPR-associated endonuclease Cas3 n=1 Tax=Neisseria subflava TaxID=28449 RepID=A0A9X9N2A4_NEISU|nr:hypothetical protein [Neisseria subflava]UTG70956.1 hypothetical protein KCG54_04155 [Neisseria subflava]
MKQKQPKTCVWISAVGKKGILQRSHSVNVGEMVAEFARVFGAQEQACQMGKLHDLGKYSEPFDR